MVQLVTTQNSHLSSIWFFPNPWPAMNGGLFSSPCGLVKYSIAYLSRLYDLGDPTSYNWFQRVQYFFCVSKGDAWSLRKAEICWPPKNCPISLPTHSSSTCKSHHFLPWNHIPMIRSFWLHLKRSNAGAFVSPIKRGKESDGRDQILTMFQSLSFIVFSPIDQRHHKDQTFCKPRES